MIVNKISHNTEVPAAVDVSADVCIGDVYRRCIGNCGVDDDVKTVLTVWSRYALSSSKDISCYVYIQVGFFY